MGTDGQHNERDHRPFGGQNVAQLLDGVHILLQLADGHVAFGQLRRGQVVKHTEETVYGVSSFWPDEADEYRLLALARDHWQIENGQHHRRDRTQDEDRCLVRETNTVRVLSLFPSLAIFLYEGQRGRRGGQRSLPDFER